MRPASPWPLSLLHPQYSPAGVLGFPPPPGQVSRASPLQGASWLPEPELHSPAAQPCVTVTVGHLADNHAPDQVRSHLDNRQPADPVVCQALACPMAQRAPQLRQRGDASRKGPRGSHRDSLWGTSRGVCTQSSRETVRAEGCPLVCLYGNLKGGPCALAFLGPNPDWLCQPDDEKHLGVSLISPVGERPEKELGASTLTQREVALQCWGDVTLYP